MICWPYMTGAPMLQGAVKTGLEGAWRSLLCHYANPEYDRKYATMYNPKMQYNPKHDPKNDPERHIYQEPNSGPEFDSLLQVTLTLTQTQALSMIVSSKRMSVYLTTYDNTSNRSHRRNAIVAGRWAIAFLREGPRHPHPCDVAVQVALPDACPG